MRILDYLTDPTLRAIVLPGAITGMAIALIGALLSVVVVLKRLSFIGQGISHAAFGGMGVAAVLGVAGAVMTPAQSAAQLAIVVAFCLGAAIVISRLTETRGTSADTAIGIVLVASMAAGALMLSYAFRRHGNAAQSWESVLFGSVLAVSWRDAAIAVSVSAAVGLVAWWRRRELLFWAFDEAAAPAFGVRMSRVRTMMLALLCLQIVASMKLAGVVLATAMLVLPGAAALRISRQLERVFVIAAVMAAAGVAVGLSASVQFDLPPGPAIVAALTVMYAAARLRRGS